MGINKAISFYRKHNEIISNVFFLGIEKLFFFVMVFYTEAMISRTLGIEIYGQWLYAVNIILVVSSLTLVAGSEIVVPALARNPKLRWHILTSAFIIRIIFSILAFVGVYSYIFIFIHNDNLRLMLQALVLVLLTMEPFGVVINYYQSKVRVGSVVFARLFSLFIRGGVVSLAVWLNYDYLIYFCRSIEAFVLAIILFFLILRQGYKWSFSRGVFTKIFIRGAKLWAPLVLMLIYMRSDRFFVEHYLGYKELANYGIAVQVIEQLMLLVSIIIQSVGPKLIFKKESIDKRKIIFLILVITVPMQIIAACFLPYFISHVFGASYIKAGFLAVNMLPAILFYSIDMVYMQYIYRDKRYGLVLIKWFLMLLISAISYYVWLSVLDKTNVAIVFVFNYFSMLLVTLSVFYVKQKIK